MGVREIRMVGVDGETLVRRRNERERPMSLWVGARGGNRPGESEPFAGPFVLRGIAGVVSLKDDFDVSQRTALRVAHEAADGVGHAGELQFVFRGKAG